MKSYRANVIYNGGMHMGRMFVQDDCLIFQSNKRTLPQCVKNQKFLYEDVKTVSTSRFHFIFPKVELVTPKGIKKFVLMNRKSFLQELNKRKGH